MCITNQHYHCYLLMSPSLPIKDVPRISCTCARHINMQFMVQCFSRCREMFDDETLGIKSLGTESANPPPPLSIKLITESTLCPLEDSKPFRPPQCYDGTCSKCGIKKLDLNVQVDKMVRVGSLDSGKHVSSICFSSSRDISPKL